MRPDRSEPQTPIHVTDLTAWHVRVRLKKEIRHASHTRTDNDTLIVRCRLTDGSTGWGEGLPRPYVTGESMESALRILRETDLSAEFNRPITGPDCALAALDHLTLSGAFTDPRQCFGNAVRAAIELAVLDAVCRWRKEPLSAVTTWLDETVPIRQQAPRVRYSGIITASTAHKQRTQALKMRLYGFRQTKIKVGTEGVDDVELLRRARRILGHRMDIRVDANEAWTPDVVVDRLNRLSEFHVTSFEQPVPADDVECLRDVRRRTGAVVMLDESLCSLLDAERAIAGQWCDLFNIRLSKCGGFVPSLRLAVRAHDAGLGYQLGCQVGETGILSAAGRHFATSVAGIRYLEGSYDRFLVKDTLVDRNLTFGFGGTAPALSRPGLGVQVDTAAVERAAVERIEWIVANE